jgi:hypothetical protein
MNGKDLTTSTLDKLCEVLGLEVVPIRPEDYGTTEIGKWVLYDRMQRAESMESRIKELEKQLTTRMDQVERLLTELLTHVKEQRSRDGPTLHGPRATTT